MALRILRVKIGYKNIGYFNKYNLKFGMQSETTIKSVDERNN